MSQAHRDGDKRACDATTIVEGQKNVYVNGKLWAVEGDPNSHGDGGLIATQKTNVFINGKQVIVNAPDLAEPDDAGHVGTQDETAEGSDNVFAGS
jgi:uncharacterized Zn-binding protein involved in type VI secretion